MSIGRAIVGAVLLLSLGCDGKSETDDSRWREVADDTEALADASDAVQMGMDVCSDAYETCVATPGICQAALEGCLGDVLDDLPGIDPEDLPDIPDVPDLPDLPDLPDIPDLPEPGDWPGGGGDVPGGDCVDGLSDCLAGGDPLTCATEVEACVDEELSSFCEEQHAACVDAGAPEDICDSILASC